MRWFWQSKPKVQTQGSWPTPETDYEGNELWAKAFSKPISRVIVHSYPPDLKFAPILAGLNQQAAKFAYEQQFHQANSIWWLFPW
jgi:hypothetical protein